WILLLHERVTDELPRLGDDRVHLAVVLFSAPTQSAEARSRNPRSIFATEVDVPPHRRVVLLVLWTSALDRERAASAVALLTPEESLHELAGRRVLVEVEDLRVEATDVCIASRTRVGRLHDRVEAGEALGETHDRGSPVAGDLGKGLVLRREELLRF